MLPLFGLPTLDTYAATRCYAPVGSIRSKWNEPSCYGPTRERIPQARMDAQSFILPELLQPRPVRPRVHADAVQRFEEMAWSIAQEDVCRDDRVVDIASTPSNEVEFEFEYEFDTESESDSGSFFPAAESSPPLSIFQVYKSTPEHGDNGFQYPPPPDLFHPRPILPCVHADAIQHFEELIMAAIGDDSMEDRPVDDAHVPCPEFDSDSGSDSGADSPILTPIPLSKIEPSPAPSAGLACLSPGFLDYFPDPSPWGRNYARGPSPSKLPRPTFSLCKLRRLAQARERDLLFQT